MTATEHLRRFPDGLPDELLALDDLDLLRALGSPTLIRVRGSEEAPPRGIACLLHGDEDTGYHAALRILRRRRRYPFDLYVVVGNVQAALVDGGYRHRYLDDQEDLNRVWGEEPTTRLRHAAAEILEELREAKLSALVDLHNNSGSNPFYAIVPQLDEPTVNLATLFSTTLLHWDLEVATLMEGLRDVCPAVAVECGMAGRRESLAFAVDGLRRYLGAPPPRDDIVERDYDLLGRLRKVTVRPEVQLDFAEELREDIDFAVAPGNDAFNFATMPAGHVIGRVPSGYSCPLVVVETGGQEVTEELFEVAADGLVRTTRELTPVMMTRTATAARKDCLFYVAESIAG